MCKYKYLGSSKKEFKFIPLLPNSSHEQANWSANIYELYIDVVTRIHFFVHLFFTMLLKIHLNLWGINLYNMIYIFNNQHVLG